MFQINPIKTLSTVLIFFGTLAFFDVYAEAKEDPREKFSGIWKGDLVINESTTLLVEFIVKNEGENGYTSVLNAPDQANLQNIPVSSFEVTGDQVVFVVAEVNGVYEGILKDGNITGKWKQQGTAFDLELTPYIEEKIPQNLIAQLKGPWTGVLHVPNTDRKLSLVLKFEADPDSGSGVSATLDSPEQSVFGIEMDQVTMHNSVLTVKVLRPEMSFKGQVQGSQLVGEWTQGGSAPLTFNKGEYQTARLDIDKASRKKLEGNWYGEFSNGIGIALKFREGNDGQFIASLDSPYEGRKGIPVSALTIDDDNISMSIDGVGATFTGKFVAEGIKGIFSAGETKNELTVERGEYVMEALKVSKDTADRLVGKWEGNTANTRMVLRFELNDEGNLIALQDIPNRQLFSLPISDLVVDGQKLSMVVKGIAAEFEGEISSDAISGQWTMPSLQFPVELSRVDNIGE